MECDFGHKVGDRVKDFRARVRVRSPKFSNPRVRVPQKKLGIRIPDNKLFQIFINFILNLFTLHAKKPEKSIS